MASMSQVTLLSTFLVSAIYASFPHTDLNARQDEIRYCKVIIYTAERLLESHSDVGFWMAIKDANAALGTYSAFPNDRNYKVLLVAMGELREYPLPLDNSIILAEMLDDLARDLKKKKDGKALVRKWIKLKRKVFSGVDSKGKQWKSGKEERDQMRKYIQQMEKALGRKTSSDSDLESEDDEQPPPWPKDDNTKACRNNYMAYPGDEEQWEFIADKLVERCKELEPGDKHNGAQSDANSIGSQAKDGTSRDNPWSKLFESFGIRIH